MKPTTIAPRSAASTQVGTVYSPRRLRWISSTILSRRRCMKLAFTSSGVRSRRSSGCVGSVITQVSHRGDQALHPLVVGAERVLAQDRALRLVVELEVHPVDGEVAPL